MGVLGWIAVVIAVVLVVLIGQFIYLSVVIRWSDEKTNGLGYYGLPPRGRKQYKTTLRRHARLLYPILRLIGRSSSFTFEKASFLHAGVAGPRGTCTQQSFARAMAYEPQAEDVFVVTQMKCGTTWMQHVVYETLLRGRGDIVESGRTLYALSPWLESVKSVPIEDAPLIGTERPSRIIKTHLPAHLCPFSREARYIYVARHPVSCLASCADFVRTNMGAMAPAPEVVEGWFRSDLMWWGTWPEHVKGWWQRAQTEDNVLFVRFEQMKQDLAGVVQQVADFLAIRPLDDHEMARVVEKCGFHYMQQHKNAFEMNPPHLLQTNAELFVRGSSDRHRDITPEARRRILDWCAAELRDTTFPSEQAYPDLAASRGA